MFTMLITLIFSLSATNYLYSMDASIPLIKSKELSQHLILKNTTSWKLLVQYSHKNSTTVLGATLVPKSAFILEDPENVQSLCVIPSGRYWGKTQIGTPKDILTLIDFLVQTNKEAHIEVSIELSEQYTILKHITPFTYRIKGESTDQLLQMIGVPDSLTLQDAFPDVKYALEKEVIPFPRHYLSLPHTTSSISQEASLEETHQRMRKQWTHLYESNCDESNCEYVENVLDILNRAYLVIKTQHKLSSQPLIQKLMSKGVVLSLEDTFQGNSIEEVTQAYDKAISVLQPFSDTNGWTEVKECLKEEYNLLRLITTLKCKVLTKNRTSKKGILQALRGNNMGSIVPLEELTETIHQQDEVANFMLNKALNEAAEKGDVATVKQLLVEGANPKAQFPHTGTALDIATKKGHAEIIAILSKN